MSVDIVQLDAQLHNLTLHFEQKLQDLQNNYSQLFTVWEENQNTFYLEINAFLVFIMGAGFGLVECGSVRAKNAATIVLKNILDTMICGIAYWIFGYALAYGGDPNPFCGTRFWAGEQMNPKLTIFWFYQFSFASTTATIISGAIAERCQFGAYILYSFIVSGFIYPIQCHWAWDKSGWLRKGDGTVGFRDYSGSGVVHMCGGVISLVAAAIMGPRLGRFKNSNREDPIIHHSVPLYAIGASILFMGFLAFNGSSTQSVTQPGDGIAAANSVRNTVISWSFAAVTGTFMSKIISAIKTRGHGKYSFFATINCGICGMVAICAGCDKVHDWGAAAIGVIAALGYFAWSWFISFCRVDDAVDAVAIHFNSGFWGLIAQPILSRDGLVFKVRTPEAGRAWLALGWNVAGAASIIAWAAITSSLVFGLLRLLRLLRIPEDVERIGMDTEDIVEACYPTEAYVGLSKFAYPVDAHINNMLAVRKAETPPIDNTQF